MMKFELHFTRSANEQLLALEEAKDKKGIFRQMRKTLGFMEVNTRHPSLQTHEFTSLKGKNGEKIFESYVQNRTPGAYRIFWHYGPGKQQITVIAIVPHP